MSWWKSNLFLIELISRWTKIISFKFFRRMLFATDWGSDFVCSCGDDWYIFTVNRNNLFFWFRRHFRFNHLQSTGLLPFGTRICCIVWNMPENGSDKTLILTYFTWCWFFGQNLRQKFYGKSVGTSRFRKKGYIHDTNLMIGLTQSFNKGLCLWTKKIIILIFMYLSR